MSIQYRFFTIPIKSVEEAERELNAFLRSHRTLTVHREFVPGGENSFWALGVEYLTGGDSVNAATGNTRKRVDYKELLSPEDFALFVKLRDWRKTVAERDGVPVFTIFTNEQLAEIVKTKAVGKAALLKINGVGQGRVEKYGAEMTAILNASTDDGGDGD